MRKGKKIFAILMLFFIAVFVTACNNGISQEEFNSLKTENEDLQSKYDKLNEDFTKMKTDYSAELENKTTSILEDAPLQYANAWAKTSFGDNARCAVSDNYLHVLVHTDLEVTSQNVNTVYTQFVSSVKLYKAAYDTTSTGYPFETISVTFLDVNETEFLNISFLKSGDTFKLNKVLIEATNAETIISGLSNNN